MTAAARAVARSEQLRRPEKAAQIHAPFVCVRPSCRGTLVEDNAAPPSSLACTKCGERHPIIAGELPVLTPQSSRHLAAEAIRLRRDIEWYRGQSGLLSASERRFPRRAAGHAKMRLALAQTSIFLEEVLATILPHLDRLMLLEVAASPARDPAAYGARKLCPLLRRDFSREAAAEAEIEALTAAVRAELDTTPAGHAPILVVGCGTGRVAEELADAGHTIVAVDLSPLLLVAALLVRRQPRALCDFQTRNARESGDQAHTFTAHHRLPVLRNPVKYVVGDASALPLGDRGFAKIVSVYFTDVVPLSRLLPEVWRLLAPGGQFIHVGPLGYHFDDPGEHHAAADLLDELRFAGFDVSAPRYMQSTHQATGTSLYTARFENLVFSAFKVAPRLTIDCPAPPFAPPRSSRPVP